MNRFYGLQALRFFAAFAVLLFHAFIYFDKFHHGGWSIGALFDPTLLSRGVTVFFVISGFVMAMAIERLQPLAFAMHRVVRIYFGYFMAIGFAVMVKLAIFKGFPLFTLHPVYISLLPFGVSDHPLGVEWTLVYEMFFYAVMTLMCALTVGLRKYFMGFWLLCILMANFGGITNHAFSVLHPIFWEIPFSLYNVHFILGVFCWWYFRLLNKLPALYVFPFGVAAIVMAEVFISQSSIRELVAGVGSVALVISAISAKSVEKLSAQNLLVRYGDTSYGIYLVHVVVITTVFAGFHANGLSALLGAIILALSAGLVFGALEFFLYVRIKKYIDSRLMRAP